MLLITISTIVRHEVFGISSLVIPDENERIYFPSSQLTYAGALQFEITYKKAYFTFPIFENLSYSFYFDSSYGFGFAYGNLSSLSIGANAFKHKNEFYFIIGLHYKFLKNSELKLAIDIKDSAYFRGFFSIGAFEQTNFRLAIERRNNIFLSLGIFYEPTIYRFLSFGISAIDSNYYAFSNVEFFIYRQYVGLRAGVYENLRENSIFLNYGFSLNYENLRADIILNEEDFKIGFYYKFKIF
ncbi:MAG: hypothetical protein N2504_00765 [candidate division WOR-3 bacterium]|nr:hypothetical protein [candidate division WOR-3 bacterium]MCX7947106.1 hypothetical protein [candidate division WOR-3 bacterium]MDW8149853.1 hypothetical protein [candidate division WOR-3 bacterium]